MALGLIGVENDNGATVPVKGTVEGHVEVAIHDPRLPFGSVHTERLSPIFQVDAVYGIPTGDTTVTTATSGGVTGTNNLFTCATGTTVGAFGALQSKKRLRYRPGQGVVARFAGLYSAPAARSIVIAGIGTGESGYYFGYYDVAGSVPEFGILYSTGGVREIRTLTITTKSSTAENAVVTLNDVAFNVAVTNGASTAQTAYELSLGTYTGWTCYSLGATVVFLSADVGAKSGAFSVAGTTIVGSFATTLAGVAVTNLFIPQSEWNGDPCNGRGDTGYTLNPQKGNVYQIGVAYLGFGAVTFSVMMTFDGGNNASWATVHTIKHPNSRITPHMSNPSFPFTMAAYSAGSTTDVSVSVGSFAGFIEGEKVNTGGRFAYTALSTAVDAASYRALLTVRNKATYGGRASQAVLNIKSFGGAMEGSNPATLFLIRNGTLAGAPNFADWSSTSCTAVDTAATTVSFTDNNQVLMAVPIGKNGNFTLSPSDEVTLQPNETLTLAARSTFGAPSYVTGSLNTREDT